MYNYVDLGKIKTPGCHIGCDYAVYLSTFKPFESFLSIELFNIPMETFFSNRNEARVSKSLNFSFGFAKYNYLPLFIR